MILHPSFKTAYFRSAGWKEDWINSAVEACRKLWCNRYENLARPGEDKAKKAPSQSASQEKNYLEMVMQQHFQAAGELHQPTDELSANLYQPPTLSSGGEWMESESILVSLSWPWTFTLPQQRLCLLNGYSAGDVFLLVTSETVYMLLLCAR
ncbi:hypothetical protein V5O48_016190 [Marasmius crinis-equi]|uniref:Transposase n=1 Tax=Marasmius crinis-equi TaxID=585013 RepID=A0ABR3ESG8_9AGAR